MKTEISNPYLDQQCFFCGAGNPAGLHLRFYLDDDTQEVSTEYVASEPFVGLGNILHGGIQAGLLDEIMGWTALVLGGQQGVTSELTVKFLRPVYLGQRLLISCRIAGRSGSRVRLEASIGSPEGAIYAEASGTYHFLPQHKLEELVNGSVRRPPTS